MKETVVLAINASWNIVNFRSGLVRALKREGYDVVAITPVDAHVPQLKALGITHVPIAMDQKGVSILGDTRLTLAYWRILRRIRPSYFAGYTIKPNIYGTLAAQSLGISTINTMTGLGTAFLGPRGWLRRLVTLLYRVAFARSEVVFFQNDEDRDLFVEEGIVPAGKTQLVPGSGIDLQRFQPQPPRPDDGRFTFLLTARMLRDKGILEFVEAARAVRGTHPHARFQLLGFVDQPNRSAIGRDELDRWVAEGVVEYLGHTDDVRPYVAAADCVVLPSYREGLPRALLEAAAMGKPLISTEVPGCRYIARHGDNGLLCPARDADGLAHILRQMLDMPAAERAAMGARSRQIAEEEFSEEVVIDRFLETLRRIRERKR